MALYVWDARLTEQWEPDFELGLFDRKAKAVKACQDYADNPDNIRAIKLYFNIDLIYGCFYASACLLNRLSYRHICYQYKKQPKYLLHLSVLFL